MKLRHNNQYKYKTGTTKHGTCYLQRLFWFSQYDALFVRTSQDAFFFISEEEVCALALQAPQEYEVPPATRLLPSAFVRAWAINNMKERYWRQCHEYARQQQLRKRR